MGDERTIRAIDRDAALPNSRVKMLKAKCADGPCWHWETPRTSLKSENPDSSLTSFLERHCAIFPVLKRYAADADVYLEVVARYAEGEEPQGIFLSQRTIQLIGEMGAAFDNDVVIERVS